MKRVIDLDEYQLEACKRHVKEGYANLLEEAVVNGKPLDSVLDEIRAEIIEMRSKQNVGVLECLDIIDRHRTERSDKKWYR